MITIETEKAAMDVPAPAAGRVAQVKLKKGDKVSEGSLILVLETEAPPAPDAKPAAPAAAEAKAARPAAAVSTPAPASAPENAATPAPPAPAPASAPAP